MSWGKSPNVLGFLGVKPLSPHFRIFYKKPAEFENENVGSPYDTRVRVLLGITDT